MSSYGVFRRVKGTAYGIKEVAGPYPSERAAKNRKKQAFSGGKKFKHQRSDAWPADYMVLAHGTQKVDRVKRW
jgi:hypothetical protein